MAKFIRYALATVCFAASAGCLALWGATVSENATYYIVQLRTSDSIMQLHAREERGVFNLFESPADPTSVYAWDLRFLTYPREEWDQWFPEYPPQKKFGELPFGGRAIYFPLWYPALLFALAGIAAIRFRRQFSLRSALVATSATAALIAMAAVL